MNVGRILVVLRVLSVVVHVDARVRLLIAVDCSQHQVQVCICRRRDSVTSFTHDQHRNLVILDEIFDTGKG